MKAQIVMIVWMSLGILAHAVNDGKPRDLKYNLAQQMLNAGILAVLLWWGGFWSPWVG